MCLLFLFNQIVFFLSYIMRRFSKKTSLWNCHYLALPGSKLLSHPFISKYNIINARLNLIHDLSSCSIILELTTVNLKIAQFYNVWKVTVARFRIYIYIFIFGRFFHRYSTLHQYKYQLVDISLSYFFNDNRNRRYFT